ncbi:hypothetical protein V5799_006673 [Amblyomma americanum]|uniref:Uncharacterized protein n=1 Tax=Amblyomma americanum TaxID=6943 RepID=A0AAQ4DVR0_AMBAM
MEDQEGWIPVRRRHRRLDTRTTRLTTILFRPRPPATLQAAVKEDWSSCLYAMPGVCEVRINRRRNLVSADVLTEEARKRLLDVTSLLSTSVHAFEAPPTDGYIGAVHGVSREVPASTIADSIESAVPVKSVRRGPHAVAVRFTAPPPDHVFIAGMRFSGWTQGHRPQLPSQAAAEPRDSSPPADRQP